MQTASLLLSGLATEFDRRVKQRYPFFQSVTISTRDVRGIQMKRLDALSRDISFHGIGLLHNVPLPLQHVTLAIPTSADNPVSINAEIRWCESFGDQWYLSGAQFNRLMIEELPAFRP